MPTYRIKHITRYLYQSTVIDCANHIMLYPLKSEHQQLKKQEIIISHQPEVETFEDYFGNTIGIFSILQPIHEIVIESNLEIETFPIEIKAHQYTATEKWTKLAAMRDEFPWLDFMFVEKSAILESVQAKVKELVDFSETPFINAQRLSGFVFEQFEYDKSVTNVETQIDTVWNLKAGVCQDFAHILLYMLRIAGIPSRYVSGYICPKNHELRGEGATHAWVEVCIPFLGWVGIDPTNNCVVSDRHVRLATGRNFSDCTPVKGTYKGSSEHTLEVSVIIENGDQQNVSPNPGIPEVFSYQSKNPGADNNSYRKFMEIQQQQ